MEGQNILPATITDFAVSNVEDSYTGKLQYYPTLDRIDLKYNQNHHFIQYRLFLQQSG